MRDIALRRYSASLESGWITRGMPEFDQYYEIFYLMNNPDLVKQGSRNKLLLSTKLVHDVWRGGEGDRVPENTPLFGKVGHRVISMLFQEEALARQELETN